MAEIVRYFCCPCLKQIQKNCSLEYAFEITKSAAYVIHQYALQLIEL